MGMARQSDPSPASHARPVPAIPVLLTRPRAQAEAFALRLTARFGDRISPVVAPLMAPEFLSPSLPEGSFDAVVFTSAQAVEGAVRLRAPLPEMAWCVGRATAAAATAAGYRALSADGDAQALVTAILADPPDGRILYIRGVDTSADIASILNSNDIPTLSLQVYLQRPLPLADESRRLLQQDGPVILPLFSPRSARLFLDAMPPRHRAALRIAAISAAVADSARDIPHSHLCIAARPDAEAMLDAVETLLAAAPLP